MEENDDLLLMAVFLKNCYRHATDDALIYITKNKWKKWRNVTKTATLLPLLESLLVTYYKKQLNQYV